MLMRAGFAKKRMKRRSVVMRPHIGRSVECQLTHSIAAKRLKYASKTHKNKKQAAANDGPHVMLALPPRHLSAYRRQNAQSWRIITTTHFTTIRDIHACIPWSTSAIYMPVQYTDTDSTSIVLKLCMYVKRRFLNIRDSFH